MLPNFEKLCSVLKLSNIPVYRDDASEGQDYPYIVYEFVNDSPKHASNTVVSENLLYQVSYITEGTELDLMLIKELFAEYGVYYSGFTGGPYDENDEKVTQFNTLVRCRHE